MPGQPGAQPPALDPRRFEQLRAAVLQRAALLVPEWRASDPDDVGAALAAIFAHDLELLLDRLNRVPEKNLLAFLDMLGVGLLPPGAARGPLVFGLAPASTAALDSAGATGLVPAGTQAATVQTATQPAVTFETEADLAVVAARLIESFTIDPHTDRFGDWTAIVAAAGGARTAVFPPFRGDRPIPHNMALGLDPLLRLSRPATLRLRLDLASSLTDAQVEGHLRSLAWERRVPAGDGWQPVEPPPVASTIEVGGGQAAEIIFEGLAGVEPLPLGSAQAAPPRIDRWLRASLTTPMTKRPGFEAIEVTGLSAQIELPTSGDGVPPDHAIVNGATVDLSRPFQAFGPNPQYGDSLFIGSEEALAGAPAEPPGQAAPAGSVQIHLELAKSDATVIWERAVREGEEVIWIDADARDETLGFTEDASLLQLPLGQELPFADKRVGDGIGFLYRARIERGRYARTPLVRQFFLLMDGNPRAPVRGFTSETPLDLFIISQAAGGAAVDLSPLSPINLRAPFFPFGAAPEPGRTFYFIVPQTPPRLTREPLIRLAQPSARVGWEYLSASGWRPLGESGADGSVVKLADDFADTTRALTAPSGIVSFARPPDLAQAEIDGVLSSWVRARLLAGGYGRPLTLEPVDPADPQLGFRVRPGTGAVDPPLIEAVSLTYIREEPRPRIVTRNGFRSRDHTEVNLAADGRFRPFEPVEETVPTLYLGFDRPLPSVAVNLLFIVPTRQLVEPLAGVSRSGGFGSIARPGLTPGLAPRDGLDAVTADADAPGLDAPGLDTDAPAPEQPIRWEYWNGHTWAALTVADGTSNLTESGIVQLLGPSDMAPLPGLEDATRHWLRIVRQTADKEYDPLLSGVFVNAVDAVQAATVRNEVLGSSTGGKRQAFRLARRPVFSGQQLLVTEPEPPPGDELRELVQEEGADAVLRVVGLDGLTRALVRWHEVGSLKQSGPRSRHYTLDRINGEVRFGDSERGMIPPIGRDNIVCAQYRAGGGAEGNQPAAAVSVLKSAIPYIATVANPIPADGGSGAETVAGVLVRGPQTLAHRGRAVTAADFEWLARQAAGTRVARARCLPNRGRSLAFSPGWVTVVIVPDGPETRPLPSSQLIREVEDDLAARVSATLLEAAPARVNVVGPGYLPVELHVSVRPRSLPRAEETRAAVLAALNAFLHPLTGGPEGTGWLFGRDVFVSELFAQLEALPSVEHVKMLTFRPTLATLPLQLTAPLGPPATVQPGARVLLTLPSAAGATPATLTGVLAEPIPAGQLTRSLMVVLFREGERISVGPRGGAIETTIRGITGASLLVDPFEPRSDLPAGSEVSATGGISRGQLALGLAADTVVDRLELTPVDLATVLVTLPDSNIGASRLPNGDPIRFPPDGGARRVAGLGRRLRVPEVSLVYSGQHQIEVAVE